MNTIKKFHWYWAWEDEKEEAWLREQSLEGLHLRKVSFPSVYTFEQGDPIDYAYRLDYFIDRKDMSSYLQVFEDAGWDYMGEMSGWQYFRIEHVDGELPEIYSDNVSKAKKYQRLILYLIIFLPIYMNFMFTSGRSDVGYMQILSMVMFAFMLLYTYAMVRLIARVTSLKKKV